MSHDVMGKERGEAVTAAMTSHLLLHRDAGKRDIYESSPPLIWSDELKSWLTFDPDVMQEVQQSRSFAVLDQKGDTQRIKERLGLDLANIDRALSAVPTCVEGEAHAERRGALARHLALRTQSAQKRFQRSASQLCHEQLGRQGSRDVIAGLFAPLALGLASDVSGLSVAGHENYLSPVQLFDKAMGPTRRKRVDHLTGELWRQAEAHCPSAERNAAVALAILGGDTLLAALALSFADTIQANPHSSLAQIAWPDRLTKTSVPFIERTATTMTKIAGKTVAPGQVVRLYLDRFTVEAEGRRDSIFGAGRHVCLGRAVAQDAWRALAQILQSLPSRVRLDEIQYREGDCMFLFPKSLKVTIDAK